MYAFKKRNDIIDFRWRHAQISAPRPLRIVIIRNAIIDFRWLRIAISRIAHKRIRIQVNLIVWRKARSATKGMLHAVDP